MYNENFERMIALVDEFFATKNDPEQISVDKRTMARLRRIHPKTMNEIGTKKGPIAWAMVIPTTETLMDQFVSKTISEKELLRKTPLHARYDALYLCSALVLHEYRGKGLAKKLLINAVRSIRKEHDISWLFYWGFSREGKKLAAFVARDLNLPLKGRKRD
jgi:GNAT superfamily N-acetyltransferase